MLETIEFAILRRVFFYFHEGNEHHYDIISYIYIISPLWYTIMIMIYYDFVKLTVYCKPIFHRMHFYLVYSEMKQKSNDSRLIFFPKLKK